MKGSILTFHDKKSLAAISDTLGQAAMNAAFFMFSGVMWLLHLPLETYYRFEDFLRKYNL